MRRIIAVLAVAAVLIPAIAITAVVFLLLPARDTLTPAQARREVAP